MTKTPGKPEPGRPQPVPPDTPPKPPVKRPPDDPAVNPPFKGDPPPKEPTRLGHAATRAILAKEEAGPHTWVRPKRACAPISAC